MKNQNSMMNSDAAGMPAGVPTQQSPSAVGMKGANEVAQMSGNGNPMTGNEGMDQAQGHKKIAISNKDFSTMAKASGVMRKSKGV